MFFQWALYGHCKGTVWALYGHLFFVAQNGFCLRTVVERVVSKRPCPFRLKTKNPRIRAAFHSCVRPCRYPRSNPSGGFRRKLHQQLHFRSHCHCPWILEKKRQLMQNAWSTSSRCLIQCALIPRRASAWLIFFHRAQVLSL